MIRHKIPYWAKISEITGYITHISSSEISNEQGYLILQTDHSGAIMNPSGWKYDENSQNLFTEKSPEEQRWMANGEEYLNTDIPYRRDNVYGLHMEKIFDDKGDPVEIKFWKDFDGTDYSNLAIHEIRTYSRNSITGLVEKKDTIINFYHQDGHIGKTKPLTRFYNLFAGDERNNKSRTNLVTKARMWIYSDLISEFGFVTGDSYAEEVLKDLAGPIGIYTSGKRDLLIDTINTSTKSYMTPTRKATLTAILNVSYLPQT